MLLTSIISILHLLNISLCRFFRQGARNCLARLCALTAAPSCLEKTARKHENQIFQDVASDVPEEKVEAPPMPRFLARFNPLPRRNPLPRHIRRSSFGYFYPVESIYSIYSYILYSYCFSKDWILSGFHLCRIKSLRASLLPQSLRDNGDDIGLIRAQVCNSSECLKMATTLSQVSTFWAHEHTSTLTTSLFLLQNLPKGTTWNNKHMTKWYKMGYHDTIKIRHSYNASQHE